MGLDVYLEKFEDLEKHKQVEEKYGKEESKIWSFGGKKYDDLTEEEKKEASDKCNLLRKKLKVEEYEGKGIRFNSSKYPKHYFKVGYFRSSYNEGGINRILENSIHFDLYNIFDVGRGDHYIVPDWEKAREKTKQAIELFSLFIKETPFRVTRASGFHNKVSGEEEALQVFLKELKTNPKGDYSCMRGDFMFSGLKINAVIQGKEDTYLIYKANLDWYVKALEIVLETIDYVLKQKDKEKYALYWSA